MKTSMLSCAGTRRFFARFCGFVLAVTLALTASADYIADNGRTDKKTPVEVPIISDAAADGQTSAADAAPKVFELKPSDLYFPDVEKSVMDSGIGKIAVQSDGVNTSLKTFAEIQLSAITGHASFHVSDTVTEDPVYTVLGMIYQNKLWVRTPIIPVESAKLAKVFGLDPMTHNRVSPVWVMKTPAARALVMQMMSGNEDAGNSLDPDVKKALQKFASRMAAFLNLPGEFKIVPITDGEGVWAAPSQIERPELAANDPSATKIAAIDAREEPYATAMALSAAIQNAYDTQKPADLGSLVAALLGKIADDPLYMKSSIRLLDYRNSIIRPYQKAALIYFFAFVAFIIYLLTTRRVGTRISNLGSQISETAVTETQKAFSPEPAMAFAGSGPASAMPVQAVYRSPVGYGDPGLVAQQESTAGSRTMWTIAYALLGAAGLSLIAALVIRFFLGGRMPVSNMYESLTFAMGAFGVVGFIFEGIYRRGWVGVGVAFTGWCLMMMANSLPLHMRKVEPLVAVLNNLWLNFHVTSLLISYSCFLLGFLFCILFLVKEALGNKPGFLPRKEVFEYLCYRSVQVGWPLLTLGIFLGGVWANTAWGSYWSWDPKETWALITWLTYTIYLHFRMNIGWTGRRSIVAAMVGFGMVMITYFGVNYLHFLGGGMHSYAEPISQK